MTGCIDFFKIQRRIVQFHGVHPASDVHAHDIRADFVLHRHGRSDRTAFSCMNVGHDPHLCSFRQRIIAHPPNLFCRFFIERLGIAAGCTHFSMYLDHSSHLLHSESYFVSSFFRTGCRRTVFRFSGAVRRGSLR